jgi:predicted tellurium resistance membrane protein TerC
MNEIFTAESLIAFLTLTSLETVLGIDNVIFIAIVAGRLPAEQRDKARMLGLTLAVVTRILLLYTLSWMMRLTDDLFFIGSHGVSGKDLILLGGGLFLIAKATHEIHVKLEEGGHSDLERPKSAKFWGVIAQILLIDIIFSLDSVVTAVGMVNNLPIMVTAIIVSIGVMLIFSKTIVSFIERHPTIKMLALSFLILIGVMLVAEGCGKHIEKGYIYFAMAFSLMVETLNIRSRAGKQAHTGAPVAPVSPHS